jgi:organic radical activating enzyme
MKHSSNYIDSTFDDIVEGGWEQDWNPRHLEVSFGNGCNFRCGYCCPQASSSWMEEIKRHGNYDLTYNQYGIEFLGNSDFFNKDDPNPYVDAFWEWWPVLKKDLRVFRITGGEPLMNPNTFKLLKMLEDEPEPNLEIHVNSNLGVTHRLVQKLVDHVKVLLEKKAIKGFKLYTSIDTWGPQAEYIRTNLDLNLWEQNLRYYLDNLPQQDISFMVTFNVLTVANFRSLLKKILELRKVYPGNEWHQRVQFDTPYLKEPPHWMINILPESFNSYMESHLQFIADNLRKNNQVGFNEIEYEVFKRVVDYMKQNPVDSEKIKKGRRDFYVFFNETDKRNSTDFYKTFPEYIDFMALCKQEFLSYENPKD